MARDIAKFRGWVEERKGIFRKIFCVFFFSSFLASAFCSTYIYCWKKLITWQQVYTLVRFYFLDSYWSGQTYYCLRTYLYSDVFFFSNFKINLLRAQSTVDLIYISCILLSFHLYTILLHYSTGRRSWSYLNKVRRYTRCNQTLFIECW